MAGIRKILVPAILAASMAIGASPASAQQCGTLRRINSIPMTLDGIGRPFIAVTINAKPKLLLFDTGATISTVKESVVNEFKLPQRRTPDPAVSNAYGDKLNRNVTIPTLLIGRIRGNAWRFVAEPSGYDYGNAPNIAGTLAPNNFIQFDVDLDFGAKKLNLFSPNHCQGTVVYWQPKSLAIVPMQVMQSGHIYVPVSLDGERLNALLDTGAGDTIINAAVARSRFGLHANSPGVEKVGDALYARFKSLAFAGVSVANPRVLLLPDLTKKAMPFNPGSTPTAEESQGLPDLILGPSVLSKLHVYVAYRERKLYISNGP